MPFCDLHDTVHFLHFSSFSIVFEKDSMFFKNTCSSNLYLHSFAFFQLCTGQGHSRPRWQLESTDVPVDELEPNPVVQGVKLIMVSVIFLVLHSL